MKQKPRIYYSESKKAMMWDRWKQSDSLQVIAQMFDQNHSSIQGILAETGGIRPAQRSQSRLALTLIEREEISRLVTGLSLRQIASRLHLGSSRHIIEPSSFFPLNRPPLSGFGRIQPKDIAAFTETLFVISFFGLSRSMNSNNS